MFILAGAYNELRADYDETPKKPIQWCERIYGQYPPPTAEIYSNNGVYGFIVIAIVRRRKLIKMLDKMKQQIHEEREISASREEYYRAHMIIQEEQHNAELHARDDSHRAELKIHDDYYRDELYEKTMEVNRLRAMIHHH
jgi:hypothetical protein